MRKCYVLNRRFLFILFKQVVINHSVSALICFSSHISFSFTMVFRTLPCTSRFGKNLFDFFLFSYHWHLLRTRIPSGMSSKISSTSRLCLLCNFIFSSLWIFVSRTFILSSKLLIFLLFFPFQVIQRKLCRICESHIWKNREPFLSLEF